MEEQEQKEKKGLEELKTENNLGFGQTFRKLENVSEWLEKQNHSRCFSLNISLHILPSSIDRFASSVVLGVLTNLVVLLLAEYWTIQK